MSVRPGAMGNEGRSRFVERWTSSAWKAAVVLAVCVVGFVLVPDRLVVALSTRVGPRVRDALALTWVILFFLAVSVLFVRIQRTR